MWNLKCTIIPLLIGATGIVTRILRKNWEDVPGKRSIGSLKKTAILAVVYVRKNGEDIPGKHLIDSLQRQLYLQWCM